MPALYGFREGVAQGAGVAAGADSPEGFDLDLPGSLLGDTELLGDLPQGTGLSAVEPVAHLDDPGLPLGQRSHGLDERQLPLTGLYPGVVVAGTLVGEQLAHLGAFFALDPGVDAADGLPDFAQPPGLLGLDPEPLYYLFLGRLTAQLQAQGVLGTAQAVDGVHNVRRQPDGPGVVGHGPRNGLADPPRRVRREAVSHLGVVLLLVGVEQPAAPHPAQILCENVLRFHHCVSPLVGFSYGLQVSGP